MFSRLPLALAVTAVLSGALLSGPAKAAGPITPPGKPEGPGTPGRALLAQPAKGKAALAALGDRLEEAGATNKMSGTALKRLLETDQTAAVAKDGRVFFADQITEPDLVASAAGAEAAEAVLYPPEQTFSLHSLPGSTHTVYLDFDGYTLPGDSAWVTQGGITPNAFGGSTLDTTYVQTVWRSVAEKFAPFDVDVTTQDPGEAALTRSSSLDPTFGTRVVFTDDQRARPSTCTPNGCLGLAWLNVFNVVDGAAYEPAWIYTTLQFTGQAPGRVSAATAAAAAAHEVGHTFGLRHDAATNVSYFDGSGHGNWFPLMGSSYNAVGQWSKGEYFGATNTEDDTAIIASRGAPLRTDDAGGTTLTASTRLALLGNVVDAVISTPTDADVYLVNRTCSEVLTATANGIGVGQAADLEVQVLDGTGSVLATDDPVSSQTGPYTQQPTGMDATAAVANAGPGTYYVQVRGVGRGSAVTDGYSNYGSLGGYRLTVSGCPGDPLPPPAVPTPPTVPALPSVTAPSAPGIARATSGRAGRPVNATARWTAPASNGGSAVVGYRVRALRLDSAGRVVRTYNAALVGASARSLKMRLPGGRYRFQVRAVNRIGTSPASRPSTIVVAR